MPAKSPPVKHDEPAMNGQRSRNESEGRQRRKRSDAHVGNIEEQYGVDFGVRSDMELGTLLKREGAESLSELIAQKRGKR